MKKRYQILSMLMLLIISTSSFADNKKESLKPGEVAPNFKLKNVDNSTISLSDLKDNRGAIVIFTCNHCPYSIAYEDRIIELENKYGKKGFPVIAINSNDKSIVPDDSFEKMQERAKDKSFPFPYLHDETQGTAKAYGAARTPHVFLLTKEKEGNYKIAYVGAIDDNSEDASKVKERFVENAIVDIVNGSPVKNNFTKAIGCTIKWKK
jgi:peroxiredoxin